MTKEYPGLPTQTEIKSTLMFSSRPSILHFNDLKQKAISLLEGKDLIINNLEGMLDATKKKLEEKDRVMQELRQANEINQMHYEAKLSEKDREIESLKHQNKIFEKLIEDRTHENYSLLDELEIKDDEIVEFAEWLNKEDYEPLVSGAWSNDDGNTFRTTQELLTIYRQSKQTINK